MKSGTPYGVRTHFSGFGVEYKSCTYILVVLKFYFKLIQRKADDATNLSYGAYSSIQLYLAINDLRGLPGIIRIPLPLLYIRSN